MARRMARMDKASGGGATSASQPPAPRSHSWSRSARSQHSVDGTWRSRSVTRPRPSDETEEKMKRAEAEEAFKEWLKRKSREPRGPRASPSREQISLHLKEDAKYRIYNIWHKRYSPSPSPLANGGSNGTTTTSSSTPSSRNSAS